MAGIPVLMPNTDVSLEIEPMPPLSAAETEDMKKAQRAIFIVSVATMLVSAVGIAEYLSVGLRGNRYHKFLSIFYAIAIFATSLFGLGLLLLSFILPRLPISAGAAEKLKWGAVALVKIALFLKITIHVMS